MTPAMAAGVTDRLFDVSDLVVPAGSGREGERKERLKMFGLNRTIRFELVKCSFCGKYQDKVEKNHIES